MDPNSTFAPEFAMTTDVYNVPAQKLDFTPTSAEEAELARQEAAIKENEVEEAPEPESENSDEDSDESSGSGSESESGDDNDDDEESEDEEEEEEAGSSRRPARPFHADTLAALKTIADPSVLIAAAVPASKNDVAGVATRYLAAVAAMAVPGAPDQAWLPGAGSDEDRSIGKRFNLRTILTDAEINSIIEHQYSDADFTNVIVTDNNNVSTTSTAFDNAAKAIVTAAAFRTLHYARLGDMLATWSADATKSAFRRATVVHPNELENMLSRKRVTLLNPVTRIGYSGRRYASEENSDIVVVQDSQAAVLAVQTGSSDDYSDYDASFYGGSFYGGFGYY